MTDVRPVASAVARRPRDLRVASFSDVHLGHGQTPTSKIIENLRTAFPDTPETWELDLILMGGDLFDEGMAYTNKYITEIENWLFSLARMCAKRNIVLRFLEGTSSHDRGQSAHMSKIIAQHGLVIDYKYITEVTVESIEALGISMLYVPDNIAGDGDHVWALVQAAMAEAGVTHVDYANVHGGFSYQLPNIASVQAHCHQMDRFLSIVDNYIWSGHIHIPSTWERIYCNGSFDRLNHGEEEAKGHWRALLRQNGEDEMVFHVNRGAAIYRSIDCTGMSVEQAATALEGVASLPLDSAVRVVAERGHPILTNLARLRQDYPHIRWTGKALEAGEKPESLALDLRPNVQEVPITPGNIADLLMARISTKCDNPAVVARCAELLPTFL